MISLTSPVETAAHGWPAGLKLGLLCIATLVLFSVDQLLWQGAALGGLLLLYALPGRRFLISGLGRLRMLWPFLALIFVWHLVVGDWEAGAVIGVRLVTAVGLANLVTMTTRLTDLLAVLTRLFAPLRFFGLQAETLAMAAALVIRFIPVLAQKGGLLVLAWRARAVRGAGWRIVLPLTVMAIDDAEQVAEALRARGGL